MGFLADFDLFDKLANVDLVASTKSGKRISLCLAALWLVLFSAEVVRFVRPEYYRDLSLESESVADVPELVNISLSLEVAMPCYFLHLDSLDVVGNHQLDINTTVTFRRVDARGKVFSITNRSAKGECGSCYGMLPDGECCQSCDMLLWLAVRQRREVRTDQWSQCRGLNRPISSKREAERCLLKGKISVNKVRGAFHVAPGRNVRAGAGHVHDLMNQIPGFDLSHKIERIRFGPKIPTAKQPLEGVSWRMRRVPATSQYLLLVTPVIYRKNGRVVDRQFEYTSLGRHVEMMFGTFMLPGIFFHYSFSPYRVIVNARAKSFVQFVASTCGLLAGAFALAALVDLCVAPPQEDAKGPRE